MDSPIADFVRSCGEKKTARFHMPGHKGRSFLGCEALDITEIQGADALYEAQGIIARSERNAAQLFGSHSSFFSTEGSSQCIKAMLYLLIKHRPIGTAPSIMAARNVHRSFVHACALLDIQPSWLWPEEDSSSLCSCPISAEGLERALQSLPQPPAAVYITSPDYLGGMADIAALSEVCRRHGCYLAVDDAHGAYLHFLPKPCHPLDLGADICCDSAHKTLPVLTGGAYLHIARPELEEDAKQALSLFGSTSPSYLTLASLDLCNVYLAGDYRERLRDCVERLERLRRELRSGGWQLADSDPLRLSIAAPEGCSGYELAERLRRAGAEPEYADPEHLVLMITPENDQQDLERIPSVLGRGGAPGERAALPRAEGEAVLGIREALFAPYERVSAAEALGRICAAPTVACPPAIPIAVSGERIGPKAVELFQHYGVDTVEVLR